MFRMTPGDEAVGLSMIMIEKGSLLALIVLPDDESSCPDRRLTKMAEKVLFINHQVAGSKR
jgi:hypothetical protein